jgi:hypothetical protein
VVHEVGHIIAYQKKINSRSRKILQTWYDLEMKYETAPSAKNYQKLTEYILLHEKEIENYLTESEKDNNGH